MRWYTIEMAVETSLNFKAEEALCSHSEELTDIDPQSQGSVDPRGHRSADVAADIIASSCHAISCGRIA